MKNSHTFAKHFQHFTVQSLMSVFKSLPRAEFTFEETYQGSDLWLKSSKSQNVKKKKKKKKEKNRSSD